MLLKSNRNAYYDHIYPNRGPKATVEYSARDYWQHCKCVFELTADTLQEIIHNPDPALLPFLPAFMQAALGWPYKGNKEPGPSIISM